MLTPSVVSTPVSASSPRLVQGVGTGTTSRTSPPAPAPTPSSPTPRQVSNFAPLPVRRRRNPASPTLAFDLFTELDEHRGQYSGGTDATIYAFPKYLIATIGALVERIVSLSPTISKPGDSIITSMLVKRGCEIIAESRDVQGLIGAKARFYGLGEDVVDDDINELSSYFTRFEVSIPDISGAGVQSKHNLRMPEAIKGAMIALASDLSVSHSEVCKIAIVAALKEQSGDESLSMRNLDSIDAALKVFSRRVKVRSKCLEAILASLEEERE